MDFLMRLYTTINCFPLFLGVFAFLLLAGCSSKEVILENVNKYNLLPQNVGFAGVPVYMGVKRGELHTMVVVYIEGDGRAWITRKKPSDDPTPSHSLVLKLMQKDDRPSAYLARPCMFIQNENCKQLYWTEERHSALMVNAMNAAVDKIKEYYQASEIEFVGHSGGGAMAILMAAKRNDVKRITTVAGNLDVEFFTKYHHVTPMEGSLNPVDFAEGVRLIPQLHLVGRRDSVIPENIAKRYQEKSSSSCVKVKIEDDFTHFKGWETVWPKVLDEMPKC
tara:strand:+ start:1120 stop:1953 length:834 start_codon:yes stop_codon:yes gene_type:complete